MFKAALAIGPVLSKTDAVLLHLYLASHSWRDSCRRIDHSQQDQLPELWSHTANVGRKGRTQFRRESSQNPLLVLEIGRIYKHKHTGTCTRGHTHKHTCKRTHTHTRRNAEKRTHTHTDARPCAALNKTSQTKIHLTDPLSFHQRPLCLAAAGRFMVALD